MDPGTRSATGDEAVQSFRRTGPRRVRARPCQTWIVRAPGAAPTDGMPEERLETRQRAVLRPAHQGIEQKARDAGIRA